MNTIDYLKKFFAEEKGREAAVPGLGVFYAEKEQDGKICIHFKEIAPKSKAFITYMAFEKNITEEEAVAQVEVWVRDILKSLKGVGVATLPGIGTFEVNEGRVVFLASARQELGKEERFGLESGEGVPMGNIEKEEILNAVRTPIQNAPIPTPKREEPVFASASKPAPMPKPKPSPSVVRTSKGASCPLSKRTIYVVIACILVVLLVLVCLWVKPVRNTLCGLFSGMERPVEEVVLGKTLVNTQAEAGAETEEMLTSGMTKQEEDAQIEASFKEGEVQKKAAEKAVVETKAKATLPAASSKPEAKAKASSSQTSTEEGVIQPQKGIYYIVVGSYAYLENAQTVKKEMQSLAFNIKILFDKERHIYKVSLRDFSDRESAIQFKNKLRTEKNIDGWIFEQK